jgi:uncharacterized protein (TIGR03085 family)
MGNELSHSAAGRRELADVLESAGPDSPTLCAGWSTRDLAAHLVVREHRPDTLPGLILPAMAGHTDRVRDRFAKKPYAQLIASIRSGPPFLSPWAIPGVDAAINLVEHFVHTEDIRRAVEDWAPRDLPAERQAALWRAVSHQAKRFFQSAPVGVTLSTPNHSPRAVITGEPVVVLSGPPAELVLYALGRGDHARVQIDGPVDAVRMFRRLKLRT